MGKYEKLRFGNGDDWIRKDKGLAQRYNIRLHKRGKGNKTTHVELQGYRKVLFSRNQSLIAFDEKQRLRIVLFSAQVNQNVPIKMSD